MENEMNTPRGKPTRYQAQYHSYFVGVIRGKPRGIEPKTRLKKASADFLVSEHLSTYSSPY